MSYAIFVINWPNLFLVCFIVGFTLSLLSLLMGMFHMHLHLPEHWENFFNLHHVHAHVPHVHIGVDGAHVHTAVVEKGGADISPINFSTVMAFLAWFGGTGYLLTSVYHVFYAFAFLGASLAGFVGAAFIFWFIVKVMLSHEQAMDPTEFRIIGAVGTLSLGIREGGTGELTYVQGGARKTAAARSEDGSAIPKGSEVAVVSFDRGVAYVRRWDDLEQEEATAAGRGPESR